MINHMLKIIWSRKQSNLFIFLEILFSFLVLVLISVVSLYYYHNYTQPLGFSIENVWNINAIELGDTRNGSEKRAETLEQYMNTLKGMDEVTGVGLISHKYAATMDYITASYEYESRRVPQVRWFFMDDGCQDVLNIEVIRGRWFDKSDNGTGIAPIVINKKLEDELFSGEDPIGKLVEFHMSDANYQLRVVGVVSDFRHFGPFSGLRPIALIRQHVSYRLPPWQTQLIIKTRPDVKAEFKAKLLDALQPIERSWSIDMSGYEEAQESHIRNRMRLIYSLATIAIAMVAMAVLGLIAVLWQNVRKRIQEIGLRRAKGATIMHIFQQVAGEFLIVSTVAIASGLFIVGQFQYFDVLSFIPDNVYYLGMAISVGVVYILTILITIYPSISAARIQPAEALHYE